MSLLFMLGPFLKFEGQPVLLKHPLAQDLSRSIPALEDPQGGLRIPLPALPIYRGIEPLRSFHHFDRFGIVLALAAGTLAGLGLSRLSDRLAKPGRIALATGCLLLLLLELNTQPQPQVTSLAGMERPVDTWLAALPEQHVIAEYPLSYTPKAQSLYFTTRHGQKIIHGYSIIWPTGFLEALPVLERFPDESP